MPFLTLVSQLRTGVRLTGVYKADCRCGPDITMRIGVNVTGMKACAGVNVLPT